METDKYIEVVDGKLVTAKKTGYFQIKMRGNNGKPFIDRLYNVLFEQDLCDQLFSIIKLMNLGHTCLFHKGVCTVFKSANQQNAVTLLHIVQQKHVFLVKTKGK